jgi:hypothetical protein
MQPVQPRRATPPLPLILAVVMLTAGCVSVRPSVPPAPAAPEPAGAGVRQPVVAGRPLAPLPTPTQTPASPTPPSAEEPDAPAPPAQPPPRRAADRDRPAAQSQPRSSAKSRSTSTSGSAPRKRPPAQPRAGPGPGRGYDMGALCEAAKGTVAPEIAALCR